jgi:CheY-like chemotaxis protein
VTRVTDVEDEDAPLVLVVDNNAMVLHRLHQLFTQKGYRVLECEDGDKAVDLCVAEEPELVLLSLDIPTLDGHVAALEMRESREDARIVLIASRGQMQLARDAAFSAGAVAVLQKPVTATSVDEVWDDIMGDVPDAPGVADLDQLYPDIVEKDAADVSAADLLGDLPLPPPPDALPALSKKPPRRRRGIGFLLLALVLLGGALAAIGYGLKQMGMLPF